MSTLELKNITIKAGEKTLVSDVSLSVSRGEVHVLMGPNGSGKSSLLNGIMGHPRYAQTGGQIFLDGVDITNLPVEKKAQAGIFLSLQHLPEVSGVTLTNFLHRSYRAQKGGDITPLDFYKMMEAKAKEFGIDAGFLRKYVNAGLSGGEKKQSEVLQLATLMPKFALLDEIDSGVDIDALKRVFLVIDVLRKDGVGFLLVSHNTKLLNLIHPDKVTIMKAGKVVATGGTELVEKIAANGFDVV